MVENDHVETCPGSWSLERFRQERRRRTKPPRLSSFPGDFTSFLVSPRFRAWEKKNRSRHQLVYSMSANVLELNQGFDGSLPKPLDAKRLRGLLKRKSFAVHPTEQ